MLVLGIILSFFGLGALLCLLFYPGRLRPAIFCRDHRRHGRLSQRGRRDRGNSGGGLCRRCDLGNRADRVRDGSLSGDTRYGRPLIRHTGHYRGLQRHPRAGRTQYAVRHLADDLRGDRRNMRWVHGLRPSRHVGPACIGQGFSVSPATPRLSHGTRGR
jgi:hypothetical protein